MKTFKLIGTGRLMRLCVTTCHKENATNCADSIVNPKQVFVNGMPKQIGGMKITQNAAGLVTKIESEDGVVTFEYPAAVETRAALPGQLVTAKVVQDAGTKDEDRFTLKMEIGSNGFVKHCDETDKEGNLQTWDFTYSAEGNLTGMKRSEGGNETTTITYKDGDIVKTSTVSAEEEDPYVYTISYTSDAVSAPIENKGCLMFYDTTFGVDMDEMESIYFAGLLGKATKHLPVKKAGESHSYTFTDDFTWKLDSKGFPVLLEFYDGDFKLTVPMVW